MEARCPHCGYCEHCGRSDPQPTFTPWGLPMWPPHTPPYMPFVGYDYSTTTTTTPLPPDGEVHITFKKDDAR